LSPPARDLTPPGPPPAAPPGEPRPPERLERLAQRAVGHTIGRHRIADHVTELADREVRPLGQKQNSRVTRDADLAAPERPDAGDGPYERALAGARRAGEEDRVATLHREVDVRDEGLAAGPIEIDVGQAQLSGAPVDAPQAGGRLLVHCLEMALEPGKSFDHGAPRRDLLVGLHEEAQG